MQWSIGTEVKFHSFLMLAVDSGEL